MGHYKSVLVTFLQFVFRNKSSSGILWLLLKYRNYHIILFWICVDPSSIQNINILYHLHCFVQCQWVSWCYFIHFLVLIISFPCLASEVPSILSQIFYMYLNYFPGASSYFWHGLGCFWAILRKPLKSERIFQGGKYLSCTNAATNWCGQ